MPCLTPYPFLRMLRRFATLSVGLLLLGLALPSSAQALPDDARLGPSDTLRDALTCRTAPRDLLGLLPRLRRERPDDFRQAERQYAEPLLDLYRLDLPVEAWGQTSDGIVIADNRVLMVIDAPADEVTGRLDDYLQQTESSPLAGALDEMHALIVYDGNVPGLENRVLVGCEYRFAELRLLEDPDQVIARPLTAR